MYKISNVQISVRHAAEAYNICRSSIDYWMQKLSNFTQTKKSMNKNEEVNKFIGTGKTL